MRAANDQGPTGVSASPLAAVPSARRELHERPVRVRDAPLGWWHGDGPPGVEICRLHTFAAGEQANWAHETVRGQEWPVDQPPDRTFD